jgi:glucuronosyltransferase
MIKKSSNVFISKWFPQADLLNHPNVKLFITHCGLMSMEESIDRTVPMLAIPFFVDQYQNAHTVHREQIGVQLQLEHLSEETFYDAIIEAMKPKYKENIKRFRSIMHDVPMTSRDKAVWWIEYLLRHNGKNPLKYKCAKVSLYQEYCLDIALIFTFILLILFRIINLLRQKRKVKME